MTRYISTPYNISIIILLNNRNLLLNLAKYVFYNCYVDDAIWHTSINELGIRRHIVDSKTFSINTK